MVLVWILTLLTVVAAIAYTIRVCLFQRHCEVLHPDLLAPQEMPLISVVVPARNEETNIERCVRSVLAQSYRNLELIVIDDQSTDATPEILARLAAEDTRVRVVQKGPLLPGWTGKNHAVACGAESAQGEWIVFIDADISLHRGALSAAYTVAKHKKVSLLTLWAKQRLESFWERVAQPVIIGMSLPIDPMQHVNCPKHPDVAYANGQFLMVLRSVYERLGGHTAIRDQVLEDQLLSLRFKQANEPILMMDGSRVLETRMYSSLEQLWEGWSKNNFLALRRNLWLLVGSLVSVYFVAISPFVMVLFGLLASIELQNALYIPLMLNVIAAGMMVWMRWQTRYLFDTPAWYLLTHALGGVIFMGIMLNSAYRHLTKRGVTWKGRCYGEADARL